MTQFLLALQFLTAIPIEIKGEVTPRILGRAMIWFPVIGLMLGGILALADMALRALLPPAASAAALLALWVWLTGALHLDGLMDCCDGLLVAKPAEKRLEILRDTHVGAFAVVGVFCLLLLKFSALLELPATGRTAALLVIPVLSRAAMVFAMRAYRYARQGPGLGQMFREGLRWTDVAIAGAIAVALAGLILGPLGLALAAACWLLTLLTAWWVQRRIPGLTGDVYGAINEITELGALILLLMLAQTR